MINSDTYFGTTKRSKEDPALQDFLINFRLPFHLFGFQYLIENDPKIFQDSSYLLDQE